MEEKKEHWDLSISSKNRWFDWNLKEVWRYRDLLLLLVKRDYKASFRQTILGPIWFFIQPIFTTFVYSFVFNRVAHIGTENQPPILFYLSGIILWNYFSACLLGTSNAFVSNANIFGKVYFPRLIIPISIVISNLMKFSVQLSFFLICYFYFIFIHDYHPNHSWHLMLTPVLVVIMATLGLAIGMFVSAFTTKYRDLQYLLNFGIQLLMYATPIVYPVSVVKGKLQDILMLNPMTGIIEGFKYAFLGCGEWSWGMLAYSATFGLILLAISLELFGKVEKGFMDTV
jgi:lipopolysaccharide transport system permease protein